MWSRAPDPQSCVEESKWTNEDLEPASRVVGEHPLCDHPSTAAMQTSASIFAYNCRTGLSKNERLKNKRGRFKNPMVTAFITLLLQVWSVQTALAQTRASNRPQPSRVQGWGNLFAFQKQQLTAKPADICFVGDSLTEFWTSTGAATWQLEFQDFRTVNFGIATDRTENILYRLTQTQLALSPPRAFILLAGTNNLSAEPPDTPEQTIVGIKSILAHLIKQCPKSRVYVLTLPPNGHVPDSPLRKSVLAVNDELKKLLMPEQVTLIDIYPTFADESHRWRQGMTLDGTHFSERGYDYLGRSLKPFLNWLHRN